MVIGWLQSEQAGSDRSPVGASAWAQVEAAQRQARVPCLLVPQPAHAVLAGELADGLTCFGELPPEIKRAIQMHDTGWASSDAQQIQRLRSGSSHAAHAAPVSFLAIPPAEAEEAWMASISTIETFSRPGAIVVSRHFTLLAQNDSAHHQRFIQAEKARQQKLQGSEEDLNRWTAALGFCDLVSLYLLCGLSGPVEFPLAHPSSPQAKNAPRVSMQVVGKDLRFTPETVRPGSALSIQALKHPVPAQGPRAETLTWEVQ
jgi:predicted small lipoprotein YifL